ncbi:hypothetical protein ABK040_001221 [Willaertia magna]
METKVIDKYLENLTNLYSISVSIAMNEESGDDEDNHRKEEEEEGGLIDGKFLFNNKSLKSLSVVCGTKKCSLGIKQIKEIRNLMKTGVELVEAFLKVFKMITEM